MQDFEQIVEMDEKLKEALKELYTYVVAPWRETPTCLVFNDIETSTDEELFLYANKYPIELAVYLMYTSSKDKETFFQRTLGSNYTLLKEYRYGV